MKTTKKGVLKFLFAVAITGTLLLPSLALAQDTLPATPAPAPSASDSFSGQLDELFKRETLYDNAEEEKQKNYLKHLTTSKKETTFSDVYSSIGKIMLGAATLLIFVGLVVAGVILVTGQGEENALTKVKQILMYIVIGVVLIAAAYAITIGIARIKPF